jgi:ribosomal protein L17
MKYRHLGRTSSHRQALLRNLVTSLFKHESISTTWPKAKEAQRLAEKLITLGKKNTEASRRRALSIFFVCCFLTSAFERSIYGMMRIVPVSNKCSDTA